MRVVIAGGHGQIALRLTKLLAGDGHEVVGLVRNPDHEADLAAAGGQAAVLDLEQADVAAVAGVLAGADVAIFAAGAGPGSGKDRKDTVDRGPPRCSPTRPSRPAYDATSRSDRWARTGPTRCTTTRSSPST